MLFVRILIISFLPSLLFSKLTNMVGICTPFSKTEGKMGVKGWENKYRRIGKRISKWSIEFSLYNKYPFELWHGWVLKV
jgi:hypothetical protein